MAKDRPVLLLGTQERGDSAAVLAVEADGRMRAMPSLTVPRSGARPVRIANGVLVFGAITIKAGRAVPVDAMEWLPSELARADPWRRVDGVPPATTAARAAAPDGRVIELDAIGALHVLTLDASKAPASTWFTEKPPRQARSTAHAGTRRRGRRVA